MKNNQSRGNSMEKIPLADIFAENNLVHWISENGKTILILFLAVVTLFFVAYRLSSGYIVKSELNYINAENEFQRFIAEKNGPSMQESLNKLNAMLLAHPELHAKYDGLIAEKLLATANTEESLPFANAAINRTLSENSPFYSDYSTTTLLIAEQKYEEALKNSLNLKELLSKNNDASNGLLFAFNFLRIGILQQQLGLEKDELATWNEWKTATNSKVNKESFEKLTNHFNIEKLSLTNYIETREKLLRKS